MTFPAGYLLDKTSNKTIMYLGNISYVIAFSLLGVNKVGYSYWAFLFPALFIVVVSLLIDRPQNLYFD